VHAPAVPGGDTKGECTEPPTDESNAQPQGVPIVKIDIRKVETLKLTMMKADPSDLKVIVPLEGGAWSDYGPIS
jgi:hypothetical protein